MKTTLDFEEISSWQEFENLVADYFTQIKDQKNITEIRVEPSGEGGDDGRLPHVWSGFERSIKDSLVPCFEIVFLN